MKKTFPLQREGRHPDRVLDALKHELRKYQARERRRPLPPETDFWDFVCRLGADEASAQPVHPAELNRQLDALAQGGNPNAGPTPSTSVPQALASTTLQLRRLPCMELVLWRSTPVRPLFQRLVIQRDQPGRRGNDSVRDLP